MLNKKEVTIKLNKSYTYIYPLLRNSIDFRYEKKLLNSYIHFSDQDNIFCILYDWSSDPKFLEYEGELMKNHLFIGHEDYHDKVVYKFRVTDDVAHAINNFINGEYKSFLPNQKEAILEFWGKKRPGILGSLKKVLDHKNAFVSSPPNMDDETLQKNIKVSQCKTEDFKYESN